VSIKISISLGELAPWVYLKTHKLLIILGHKRQLLLQITTTCTFRLFVSL